MWTATEQKEERGMTILLRYAGPAVDSGSMNVYDAAANMVAFSDYVVMAAHKLYGDDTEVEAKIRTFLPGSFVTDLAFHVVGVTATLLSVSPDVVGVLKVVRESLGLFKFLNGKAPEKVEHRDDRTVNVTNNNGNVIQVNIESLHLTLDPKAGLSVETFIADAIAKPGIDSVDISSEGRQVVQVNEQEASSYHQIQQPETQITENEYDTGLMIEMASFKEGNKWRMFDGDSSQPYSMEDEDFNARVNAGEPFRKGDILMCRVKVTQTQSGNVLKINRAIIKVTEHKLGQNQSSLGFDKMD